jgi:GNAT superfamily N-acetyltransferase
VLITRADGLFLSDDPGRLDRARIGEWLASSYWAAGRSAAAITASLANSRAYGAYTADGSQVGLTRAVTDQATFAWIGDVFVDAAWRGRGIGRWLVGAVVAELRELGVPRFVLATRDAHEVYAAIGFQPVRYPSFWMELDVRPDRPVPLGASAVDGHGGDGEVLLQAD